MAMITGTSNSAIISINDEDEESQLIPIHNPIQAAIQQLEVLNQLYTERNLRLEARRHRYTFRYHWDTIVCSSSGAVALIIASIYVSIKLKILLSCNKPSGSCIEVIVGSYDKNCVVGYHWCPAMWDIGTTLWNYVNINIGPTYNWANTIYDICIWPANEYGALDTFIYGLTVICNSTSGGMISVPLTIDFPISDIVMNSVFFTMSAHALGQLITWGIEMCGFEIPPLSFSEYYNVYKNLTILRENQVNYLQSLLTHGSTNQPLTIIPNENLLQESQRIFKEQSRRYIRNLTTISLYPLAFIIFYGLWMTTLKVVNAMSNHYENDPSTFIKLPSPCLENTYEAAFYSGWYGPEITTPMPGAIQYLFSSGVPSSESMEAHAINILAVGYFTAIISPIFALLSDISFKYIPSWYDRLQNNEN